MLHRKITLYFLQKLFVCCQLTWNALCATEKGCAVGLRPRSAAARCRPLTFNTFLEALVAFCCLSKAKSAASC